MSIDCIFFLMLFNLNDIIVCAFDENGKGVFIIICSTIFSIDNKLFILLLSVIILFL